MFGCQGLDIKQHVTGHYFLVAADADYQLGLTFQDYPDDQTYGVVIGYTVFAVGYNEKYIIAKQHFENIKSILNYYILPIKSEYKDFGNTGLIGPMTREQFEQKSKELNLQNVKFTINYKNLE
jgi:hypothetical protein